MARLIISGPIFLSIYAKKTANALIKLGCSEAVFGSRNCYAGLLFSRQKIGGADPEKPSLDTV